MDFKKRKALMSALNAVAAGLMIWQLLQWSWVTFWISLAFVAAAIAANRMLWRCPHCGEHLGTGAGETCPKCGRRLDDGR